MDDERDRSGGAPAGSRRAFLRSTVGVAAAGSVAGCLGDAGTGGEGAGDPPDPVDLGGGKTDDNGGMVIGEHHGPNGQVFYANHSPDGHDNPAWFHTLVHGLFPYHFARQREGWTAEAVYVTDYATVDYDTITRDGETYVSSHTAADTFGDAESMTYVRDSGVRGGMGRALLPFGADADADAFVDEHGGETMAYDDVTADFLARYRQ